jgi:hypothetical protein
MRRRALFDQFKIRVERCNAEYDDRIHDHGLVPVVVEERMSIDSGYVDLVGADDESPSALTSVIRHEVAGTCRGKVSDGLK